MWRMTSLKEKKKMHLVTKRTRVGRQSRQLPGLIIRHYTDFMVGLIQASRNHQQWVHRKHLPYTCLQGAAKKKQKNKINKNHRHRHRHSQRQRAMGVLLSCYSCMQAVGQAQPEKDTFARLWVAEGSGGNHRRMHALEEQLFFFFFFFFGIWFRALKQRLSS